MYNNPFFGLYEKALPKHLKWEDRLLVARKAGYNFMEMSIDESDERLERLQWDKIKKRKLREIIEDTEMPLLTMCLSAHRRFPIGSSFPEARRKGMEIMETAIWFAFHMGIRIIQIAGYDVLMEETSTHESREKFGKNLMKSVKLASSLGVTLAIENVDVDFGNSIDKIMYYVNAIKSPWLQIYPDIGNLTAMKQNVSQQLIIGQNHIVAIHVKDTIEGVVRRVPFGEGIVDFVSAFKILKNICFHGPFIIEMWANDKKDNFDLVKHAKEWVSDKAERA